LKNKEHKAHDSKLNGKRKIIFMKQNFPPTWHFSALCSMITLTPEQQKLRSLHT